MNHHSYENSLEKFNELVVPAIKKSSAYSVEEKCLLRQINNSIRKLKKELNENGLKGRLSSVEVSYLYTETNEDIKFIFKKETPEYVSIDFKDEYCFIYESWVVKSKQFRFFEYKIRLKKEL